MIWFFGKKKENEKQTATRNLSEGTKVKNNKTITFKMVKPEEAEQNVKENTSTTEDDRTVLIDLGSPR